MTKTASAAGSVRTIDQFLRAIGSSKVAAEANTEPGSVGGETTHPVKNVDDGTEDAKEGERSAENEKDVKADQGSPGVDSTPENVAKAAAARLRKRAEEGKSSDGNVNPPGAASDDQLQIGTVKAPTGEQSAVETSSAKPGKDDPGSAHPARTDNDELDGEKYASMSLHELASHTDKLGNQLLGLLANEMDKQAAAAAAPARPAAKVAAQVEVPAQAGWELGELLASGQFDKKAADALVAETLTEIIKTASADADNVAAYLQQLEKQARIEAAAKTRRRVKKAEGEMIPPEAMAGGDPAAMGGGPPLGEPPMDPAAGGGGGMPPEMGGEAGGGEAGPEQLEQLLALMEQLGITPEDLIAAEGGGLGEEGGDGGGGGGGLPEEGGPPEEAAPPAKPEEVAAAPGMEVEAAAKRGNAAKTTRDYISEVISRSRTARR